MSPTAYALLRYLWRQPADANVIIEELTRACRSSKTAIRAAFRELEAEGRLDMTREV